MADESVLIFDRPPLSRLISCAAVFGSAAIFFSYLADHADDLSVVTLVALALLFLGTLAAAIVQYGDHIYLAEHGVKYENRLLSMIGRPGRWMRWEDIVEVREVREKVIVLLSRDGQRMLIDAILGYPIARREILRRAPQAILSGTLAREDA
ncbi:MAG TPA: hypothetical protein VE010_03965 [Thermoanaerobaculia bacterium]|nr:hypothetical protein [Thermoanaerobaculia bacterium]